MAFSLVLYALLHYYLLLYLSSHKSETAFGCIFIAENLPICTSTAEDRRDLKPRASLTQPSISNMPVPMMSIASTGPSG
jgi:hypothetical protein